MADCNLCGNYYSSPCGCPVPPDPRDTEIATLRRDLADAQREIEGLRASLRVSQDSLAAATEAMKAARDERDAARSTAERWRVAHQENLRNAAQIADRHAGLQSATAPLAVAIRHPADTEGSLSRGSDSDRRGKDLP